MENCLIQAENLKGLQFLLEQAKLAGKIDLVYIDPPFATGNDFTIGAERSATVSGSLQDELAYSDKLKGNVFIDFLKQRMWLLKELLSEKGSIYVHTDYKIGHYIKIMMDEVFGVVNFRNDISRIKCNPKNFKRIGYGNIKDMILFYTKSSAPIWNEPKTPYTPDDLEKLFPKINAHGRRYTTVPIHAPGETKKGKSNDPFKGQLPPKGRHWRTDVPTLEKWDEEGLIEWSSKGNPRKIIFADEQEGKRVQDIWNFKDSPYPIYPTEKNADLLSLIIATSSLPSSCVLDCFCGSGTTLQAAHEQKRNWIGIEQSHQAVKVAQERLKRQGLISEKDYQFIVMN